MRIRLYGEEFEVVSDPFSEADGVVVHVTTKKDPSIRLLRIPMTVLQSAKRAAATALAAIRVESAVVAARRAIIHEQIEGSRSRQGGDGTEPPGRRRRRQYQHEGQPGHRDENADLKNADSDLSG